MRLSSAAVGLCAFGVLAGATALPTAGPGNGALSGPHYNLNLIGKTADQIGGEGQGDGHRIFVLLDGTTKIYLAEGDFNVVDYNGTDGTAKFQLPNPDPDGDGVTSYSVYVRALGPGGNGTITTCATDPGPDGILGTADDEQVCSTGQNVVSLKAHVGAPKFRNVSKQLLFVTVDIDGDGKLDSIPLFDDRLKDYFWQFDNHGLKVVQLRFYEVPTNVNVP